jgi:hypothetical protein
MDKKRAFLNNYWPWIIFLAALVLRLLLLYRFDFRLGWESHGFPNSDAREYDTLAMNILLGRGFGDYISGFKYQSFVCPFYSLFLSFIYSFCGHNYMAVKIVQLILSSLNAVVIYAIGRRLFNKPIGIIAGLIMACYLPHMWWVSPIMREGFFAFVFALAFLAIIKAVDEPLKKHLLTAGAAAGIAILTRPGGLVLFAALLAHGAAKKKLKTIAVVFLFTLLTMSPWIARSMIIHKGAVILESSGARQFWTGANPKYGGHFYSRVAWHETLWHDPFASEAERCKRLTREGAAFIRDNPKRYYTYFRKRLTDFWLLKKPDVLRFNLNNADIWLPYLVIWLGTMGAVHSLYFFSWRQSLAIISLILFYCLGAGIYGGIPRYRAPLEQFFIIFAAYSLYGFSRINRMEWRQMRMPGTGKNAGAPSHLNRTVRYLLLCGLILVLTFSIRLCIACWGPGEKIADPGVSKEEIRLALKKHSLLEEWKKQAPQKLTYRDIFLDQAANNGYLTDYDNYVVVWEIRMDNIAKDRKGNICDFVLTTNPSPHNFGQENRVIRPAKGIKIKADGFQERDAAVVIAKVRSTGKPLCDPQIEFYEILTETGKP